MKKHKYNNTSVYACAEDASRREHTPTRARIREGSHTKIFPRPAFFFGAHRRWWWWWCVDGSSSSSSSSSYLATCGITIETYPALIIYVSHVVVVRRQSSFAHRRRRVIIVVVVE
jgi:hypothetical protein